MTTEMCYKMKTTRQIRYEERLGHLRMVGGGVTGGDTTTSRWEATMAVQRQVFMRQDQRTDYMISTV